MHTRFLPPPRDQRSSLRIVPFMGRWNCPIIPSPPRAGAPLRLRHVTSSIAASVGVRKSRLVELSSCPSSARLSLRHLGTKLHLGALATPQGTADDEDDDRHHAVIRSSRDTPPVRTAQDLHATLLLFAQASSRPPTTSSASSNTQQDGYRGRKPGAPLRKVLPPDDTDCAASPSPPLHACESKLGQLSPSAAVSDGGAARALLQQLLLRYRQRQRQVPLDTSRAAPTAHDDTVTSGVATVNTDRGAAWQRAFLLFSEAIQKHRVTPTTQHINLLLKIAHQHALWHCFDGIEVFQAHLLASVQQLQKEKQQRRRQVAESVKKEKDDTAEWPASMEVAPPSQSGALLPPSLSSDLSVVELTRQLDDLRAMASALLPNAQTYDILLRAALDRGAWARALEYCAMRRRSNVAVVTDASVRQVLQVYFLAGTTAGTPCTPQGEPMTTAPPRRLPTGDRGPGLRAAARPLASDNPCNNWDSAQFPCADTIMEPHWSAAFSFFCRNQQRVTSMRTVEQLIQLLHRSSQGGAIITCVTEVCPHLVRASLQALGNNALSSSERAALLCTLRLVCDAACENGEWSVALQLLHDVVNARQQLRYARSMSTQRVWGSPHWGGELTTSPSLIGQTPSSSANQQRAATVVMTAAGLLPLSQPPSIACLGSDNDRSGGGDHPADGAEEDVVRALDEVQLSRHVLQKTLHTLRRVRRYAAVLRLYRSFPPSLRLTREEPTVRGAAADVEDEQVLVWRSMWTPRAVGYVAQAALAQKDEHVLFELCGMDEDGGTDNDDAFARQPAEVYDAALRLIQLRIIQLSRAAELSASSPSTRDTERKTHALYWTTLSQRVYAMYRRRALRALAERSTLQNSSFPQPFARQVEDPYCVARYTSKWEDKVPLLSATHAPLLQLLWKSLNARPAAPLSPPSSLVRPALAHLKRLRHPDTLSIVLFMDLLLQAYKPHHRVGVNNEEPRRHTDAEVQLCISAVQQVLNTVLEQHHLAPLNLLPATKNRPQSTQEDGRNSADADSLRQSPPAETLTTGQLTSLSVVTAAAVQRIVEVMEVVGQPLILISFLPFSVRFAWLPPGVATAALDKLEQTVQLGCTEHLTGRNHPAETPNRTSTGTLTKLSRTKERVDGAVARFVCLYARHFPHHPTSPSSLSAACRAVVEAAAVVLKELQLQGRAGHVPSSSMSFFLHALRLMWAERVARVRPMSNGSPQVLEQREMAMDELTTTCINAVVQQVGAFAVCRCTLWGDCLHLLLTYIKTPFSEVTATPAADTAVEASAVAAALPEGPVHQLPNVPLEQWSGAPLPGSSLKQAGLTLETLKVVHTLVRLCDKAEAPFVEHVVLDWLLSGVAITTSHAADGPAAQREDGTRAHRSHRLTKETPSRLSRAATAVRYLADVCAEDRTELSFLTSKPSRGGPLSSVQIESMWILLDALTWACRQRDKPLVRGLYGTLSPWLDVLASPLPFSLWNSHEVGGEVKKSQLRRAVRLHEAALSVCMAVARCLASGHHVGVQQDWPTLRKVVRQLLHSRSAHLRAFQIECASYEGGTLSPSTCYPPAPSLSPPSRVPPPLEDLTSLRATVTLAKAVAAVVVKLHRTWWHLLSDLAVGTYRADEGTGHGARSPQNTIGAPASILSLAPNMAAVEMAADEFSELCVSELLPYLLIPCLRACGDLDKTAQVPGVATPVWRRQVKAVLLEVVDAVWAVDMAHLGWRFLSRSVDCASRANAWYVTRLHSRSFTLLTIELCWRPPSPRPAVAAAAPSALSRHLQAWMLICVYACPETAVATLCHDVSSLDVGYALREGSAYMDSMQGVSDRASAPSVESAPLFLLILQEVDALTDAFLASVSAPSHHHDHADVVARTAIGARWEVRESVYRHSSKPDLVANGNTVMDYLTKPHKHFTKKVLCVVQQAAQHLLYLALCEGTTDAFFASQSVDARVSLDGHCPVLLTGARDTPREAFSPRLLCRCIGWACQAHVYPALLRAIEATAHEALRQPAAIEYVLHSMARLGNANAADDAESSGFASALPAEKFLSFYANSLTLRRICPWSEQVCVAALLACAASTARTHNAGPALFPSFLVPPLHAFPNVLSGPIFLEWRRSALAPRQSTIVTEWALRFLWGGVPLPETLDASQKATLKLFGADGRGGHAAAAPVRRAAALWLLLTQGSILPGRAHVWVSAHGIFSDDEEAATLAQLNTMADSLDAASNGFTQLMSGTPLGSTSPVEDVSSPASAVATLAQRVLQHVLTKRAVQQLLSLHREAAASASAPLPKEMAPTTFLGQGSPPRAPARLADAEVEVLVRLLPEAARGDAWMVLRRDACSGPPKPAEGKPFRPSAMTEVARNWAVEIEKLVRVFATCPTHPTACSPPSSHLEEPPSPRLHPNWAALYPVILTVTNALLQRGRGASPNSDKYFLQKDRARFDHYAAWRTTVLRHAIVQLLQAAVYTPDRNAALSTAQSDVVKDGSDGTAVLLLYYYVYQPVRAFGQPPEQAVADLRQELIQLYRWCHCGPSNDAIGVYNAASAARAGSHRTSLHHQSSLCACLCPLLWVLEPPTSSSLLSAGRMREGLAAAALRVAALILFTHHVSFNWARYRAAAPPTEVEHDAGAVLELRRSAETLFQLAGKELHDWYALYPPVSTSHVPSIPLWYDHVSRRLARAWMQIGVLLEDGASLLWTGKRLATLALHMEQKALAPQNLSVDHGAASCSAPLPTWSAAITEWLCVLPAAALIASALQRIGVGMRSTAAINEELCSFVAVVPLPGTANYAALSPSSVSLVAPMNLRTSPVAESHDGTSEPAIRKGYAQLLFHWQCMLSEVSGGSKQRPCPSRQSTIWPRLIFSRMLGNARHTAEMQQRMERFLTGPATAYLPAPQRVVSGAVSPSPRSSLNPHLEAAGTPTATTVITAESLHQAFHCLNNATEADMRVFLRLESAQHLIEQTTERQRDGSAPSPSNVDDQPGSYRNRGRAVQTAWHHIQLAAQQHRQHRWLRPPISASGDFASSTEALALSPQKWREWFLGIHPVVPHTTHFISTAVSEVVMLESCDHWQDGVDVLEGSLKTLHRTGATPVQHYLAQLLLERVRKCETVAAADRFGSRLDVYTYTTVVPDSGGAEETAATAILAFQQLWYHHMKNREMRGTAALVCRIVDLLIGHIPASARTKQAPVTSSRRPLLAKHTLMECLRCGVRDATLTRALFRLFWAQQYDRVEGVHVFLSALQAAKLARDESLAIEAMLTYLWVSRSGSTPAQRTAAWETQVLQRVEQAMEWEATVGTATLEPSFFKASLHRQHLKEAAREVAELPVCSHIFSPEAHRALWKSWTLLCRRRVISQAVALSFVELFSKLGRLTEVEELMVTTCYAVARPPPSRATGRRRE